LRKLQDEKFQGFRCRHRKPLVYFYTV